jgi:hypothetical protein
LDIVISASTHRTGSTLLQRLFNARDKTLIWGENGGCLTDFYRIFKNTKHFSRFRHRDAYFNSNEDPNQWIAGMTPPKNEVEAAIIETVKTFHEELYAKKYSDQHDLIGYKEVRYGKQELELLRKCYPECQVILLVRNPVNVWKSLSREGRKELYRTLPNFTDVWNKRVDDYYELAIKDPKMHLIRYEDIHSRQVETLNLIKEIGHLKDKEIELVLEKKINSSSKLIPLDDEELILKCCGHFMRKLGYLDRSNEVGLKD